MGLAIGILNCTQAWDTLLVQRTDALDAILESLGTQVVPPDFHDTASDSSIFGSQGSDESEAETPVFPLPGHSPTLTIRGGSGIESHKKRKHKFKREDKSKWKTLRDFVDERAINDALETIDKDRSALEVCYLNATHVELVLSMHLELAGCPCSHWNLPSDFARYLEGHP
jgi:autophagy-related protein 17